MSSDLQDALNRKNYKTLSEENAKELKNIYRKLIKKLHPDLNKENAIKNKNLLLQVTQAYENGDLETLRNLELLTDEIIEKENIENIIVLGLSVLEFIPDSKKLINKKRM